MINAIELTCPKCKQQFALSDASAFVYIDQSQMCTLEQTTDCLVMCPHCKHSSAVEYFKEIAVKNRSHVREYLKTAPKGGHYINWFI